MSVLSETMNQIHGQESQGGFRHVLPVLTALNWKDVVIVTDHHYLPEEASFFEHGVQHVLFSGSDVSSGQWVRDVMTTGAASWRPVYLLMLCSLACARSALLQASQLERELGTQTAFGMTSRWVLMTTEREPLEQLDITNVTMDNVAVLSMERKAQCMASANETSSYRISVSTLLWQPEGRTWGLVGRLMHDNGAVKSRSHGNLKDWVFPNLLRGFNGRRLRLMTKEWSTFIVSQRENGTKLWSGLYFDVLQVASQMLNFSYELVESWGDEWGLGTPSDPDTGIYGHVIRKEVDMGLVPTDMIQDRVKVMDFPSYTNTAPLVMAYRKPRADSDMWLLLGPFSTSLLLALMGAAICTALVLTLCTLASDSHSAEGSQPRRGSSCALASGSHSTDGSEPHMALVTGSCCGNGPQSSCGHRRGSVRTQVNGSHSTDGFQPHRGNTCALATGSHSGNRSPSSSGHRRGGVCNPVTDQHNNYGPQTKSSPDDHTGNSCTKPPGSHSRRGPQSSREHHRESAYKLGTDSNSANRPVDSGSKAHRGSPWSGRKGMQLMTAFEVTWSALLAKPYEARFQSRPARVVLYSWLLVSLVVVAAYSGTVTAALSVSRQQRLFSSLHDLVAKQHDYKWAVLSFSSAALVFRKSNDTILRQVWAGIERFQGEGYDVLTPDQDGLIRRLRFTDEKLVVFMFESTATAFSGDCEMELVDLGVRSTQTAPVLPKGSALTTPLSNVILRLHSSGILDKWTARWFPRAACPPDPPGPKAIALVHVGGVLTLLPIGLGLAALALAAELIYLRWRKWEGGM